MKTLILDHKHLALSIEKSVLVIQRSGERHKTIPLRLLSRVVAINRVELDTQVLTTLSEQGISFTALTGRRLDKVAQLGGRAHNQVVRKLKQLAVINSPEQRLDIARYFVQKKISNQKRLLQRFAGQRPELRRSMTQADMALDALLASLAESQDLAQLRGFEGAAAAAYFRAMVDVFPPRFNFTGRNRRPPRDPVNACLSLAYTLAHGSAVQSCHIAGLEPLAGFLHDPSFGRESLASDLMEPLRPHIDQWILELLQQRVLDEAHFYEDGEACLLSKAGRGRFYAAWESRAPALQRWLRLEARALNQHLQNIEP
ncbi:MAG: CRISPR-associated endonuclease Cas1 [Thiotrichales bacterium]